MRFDTTALMGKIFRAARVPLGSSYRDPETILALASDEMEQWIVPELLKVSGGHFVAYQDFELVSGQTRYRFPERSIRPERLEVVSSEGLLVGHLVLASGRLVDEVLAGRCPPTQGLGWWCPENNHAVVVLRSTSDITGRSLRIFYRRQPNRLIATSACWRITEINGGNILMEPINAEDGNHDTVLGELYDVVASTPTFEATEEDIEEIAGDTNLLAVSPAPTNAAVGQFVAPAGFTPVPQLPVAFLGALVEHCAATILTEQGNRAGGDAKRAVAAAKLATALTTATPRGDEAETAAQDHWDTAETW